MADQEQLRIVREGVQKWNTYTASTGRRRADLSDASLCRLDLDNINFRRVSLRDADLRSTTLKYADLRDSRLEAARLAGASLYGAVLVETNFEGADLRDVDLSEAVGNAMTNFNGAVLSGCILLEASFAGTSFIGTDLHHAKFHGANLCGANFVRADLSWAKMNSISESFGKVEYDAEPACLCKATMDGALMVGTNLQGASLVGASLCGAVLAGADLSGCDLTGADLTGAELSGANLHGAILANTDLEGIKYSQMTRWPENFELPSNVTDVTEPPFVFIYPDVPSPGKVFTVRAMITDQSLNLKFEKRIHDRSFGFLGILDLMPVEPVDMKTGFAFGVIRFCQTDVGYTITPIEVPYFSRIIWPEEYVRTSITDCIPFDRKFIYELTFVVPKKMPARWSDDEIEEFLSTEEDIDSEDVDFASMARDWGFRDFDDFLDSID